MYLSMHNGLLGEEEILAGWLKYLLSTPAQGVWLKFKLCTHSPSHLTVTSWLQQFINMPSWTLCSENETRKAATPILGNRRTQSSQACLWNGARSGLSTAL